MLGLTSGAGEEHRQGQQQVEHDMHWVFLGMATKDEPFLQICINHVDEEDALALHQGWHVNQGARPNGNESGNGGIAMLTMTMMSGWCLVLPTTTPLTQCVVTMMMTMPHPLIWHVVMCIMTVMMPCPCHYQSGLPLNALQYTQKWQWPQCDAHNDLSMSVSMWCSIVPWVPVLVAILM